MTRATSLALTGCALATLAAGALGLSWHLAEPPLKAVASILLLGAAFMFGGALSEWLGGSDHRGDGNG